MSEVVSILNEETDLTYRKWRIAALMRILFNFPAWRLPMVHGDRILSFAVSSELRDGLRLSLFTHAELFERFQAANPGSFLTADPLPLKDIFESAAPLFQTPNPADRIAMICLNPSPLVESLTSLSLPLAPDNLQAYWLAVSSERVFRARGVDQGSLKSACVRELKSAALFEISVNDSSRYMNDFGSASQKLVVCTGVDVTLRFVMMLRETGVRENLAIGMVTFSSMLSFVQQKGIDVAFVFDCFDAESNITINTITTSELGHL